MQNVQLDEAKLKTVAMCIRSIHWFIATLKNVGVPYRIISQFSLGQAHLEIAAAKLPGYGAVYSASVQEVDDYNRLALPDDYRTAEAIWYQAKNSIDTFKLIKAALVLFGSAISRLEQDLEFDPTFMARAMDGYKQWISQVTAEFSQDNANRKLIDGLGLDI